MTLTGTSQHKWTSLAVFLLINFVVAGVGGIFTANSVHTWYPTLLKPVGTPPDFVFAPVWTILYVLIAISAWRVWQRRSEMIVTPALNRYFIQLALNAAWTPLFFGLHWIAVALTDLVLLWFALLVTWRAFRRIDEKAATLLIPYALWSTFALYLNALIWWLNR